MNVQEFREKIKFNSKVVVEGREFEIQQLIKFRLNDGSHYIKLFFTDGYVLADDLGEDMFILVKEIVTDFKQPFFKEIVYGGKNFKFTYEAQAMAEEVEGEGKFQVGDREKFWDYETEKGTYLSLGMDEETGRRMDLVGKVISNEQIKVVN